MGVENRGLAKFFEEQRPRLRAVAFRMLGSLSEADDAVQQSWIRFNGSDTAVVDNLTGWLTTIVTRECLHMLRSRQNRRETSLTEASIESLTDHGSTDPEAEALLVDSLGPALLVVLDTLSPGERLAFVLHDMFGVGFDEIARVLDRTPTAARQLASRARRRVRGTATGREADLVAQRRLVDAFLAASRHGDFRELLTVLDPDVMLRVDATASPTGVTQVIRGALTIAGRALQFTRNARFAQTALVDNTVGIVVAPTGRLTHVLRFATAPDTITEIEVIMSPDRLRKIRLAVLDPVQ